LNRDGQVDLLITPPAAAETGHYLDAAVIQQHVINAPSLVRYSLPNCRRSWGRHGKKVGDWALDHYFDESTKRTTKPTK
jgi:hypothetical protein